MNGWKNAIILGGLFIICFAGAVHGSHDNDKELLSFSVNAANQILAAILTVTTVSIAGRRSSDNQGGTSVTQSKTDTTVVAGTTLPTYPKS